MEQQQQSTFEGWALVEVFGHQKYAGFVTTQAFGQSVLFRVDVPPLVERERVTKHYEYHANSDAIPPGAIVREAAVPGYTKFIGPSAIYALTPCTQEAAEKAVEAMQARKVSVVSLPPERALAPSSHAADDDVDDAEYDGADDDDEDDDDLEDDDEHD